MSLLGIYVHIPFCVKKCNYCDFVSFDNRAEAKDLYKDALISEINGFRADGYVVDTIFFGGGTPTCLGLDRLSEVMEAIFARFNVAGGAEISIETNPGIVSNYVRLRELGFNRISFGLQSSNDDELRLLGRVHKYSDFLESYGQAAEAFDNINIDVMFGIPAQTMPSWLATLNDVLNLKPAHISCYSLKIEEGTPFGEAVLDLPDEDLEREMYYKAQGTLGLYNHYEISNFALAGRECRHNIKYWRREEYAGLGVAAHSLIGNIRRENIGDMDTYINGNVAKLSGSKNLARKFRKVKSTIARGFTLQTFEPCPIFLCAKTSLPYTRTVFVDFRAIQPIFETLPNVPRKTMKETILTLQDQMEEFMFLGLRMSRGVSASEFERTFGRDICDVYGDVLGKHINNGLVKKEGDRYSLTARGVDISNVVFTDFVSI